MAVAMHCRNCGEPYSPPGPCKVCGYADNDQPPPRTAAPPAPAAATPRAAPTKQRLSATEEALLRGKQSGAGAPPKTPNQWRAGVLCPPGYEQVSEIKAGKVWLLRRVSDGEQLVGKFYSVELAQDILTQLAAACRHSGGQSLNELIEHGRVPLQVNQLTRYYSIEPYAKLGTLRAHMKPGVRQAEDRVRSVLGQLASGVRALSSARLLHRDFKPENVLVTKDAPFTIRLTDFELVRPDDSVHAESRIVENLYMSPERYAGHYNPESEWWALGLIVFEMLAGQHAFAVDGTVNRAIIMGALRDGRPIDYANVPQAWQRLLRGLLTQMPDRRWGYNEVQLFLAGKPLPEPPPFEAPRRTRPATKLLAVGAQMCATPAEVASTCALLWNEATDELLGSKRLVEWLRDVEEPEMAAQVERLRHDTGAKDADLRTLDLMLTLDPAIAPNLAGQILEPRDLAALAQRALAEPPTGAKGAPACRLVEKLFRHGVLGRFERHPTHGKPLRQLNDLWQLDAAALQGRNARLMIVTRTEPTLAYAHQLAYLLCAQVDTQWLSSERKRLARAAQVQQQLRGAPPVSNPPTPPELCALVAFEAATDARRAQQVDPPRPTAASAHGAAPSRSNSSEPPPPPAPPRRDTFGAELSLIALLLLAVGWVVWQQSKSEASPIVATTAASPAVAAPMPVAASEPEVAKLQIGGAITTDRVGDLWLGMTPASIAKKIDADFTLDSTISSLCDQWAFSRSDQKLRMVFTGGRLSVIDIQDNSVATLSGVRVGDPATKLSEVYGDRVEYWSAGGPAGKHIWIYTPKEDPKGTSHRIAFEQRNGSIVRITVGNLVDALHVCVEDHLPDNRQPARLDQSKEHLPPSVIQVLDAKFQHWHMAYVAKEDVYQQCKEQAQGGTGTTVVGDFDGDGRKDYGLQVTSFGRTYVLIATASGKLIELDRLDGRFGEILTLHRQNQPFTEVGTSNVFELKHDAVGWITCGMSGGVFVASPGESVRRVFTSD